MRRSQRSSPLRCQFPASRTMSSRPLGMSGLASAGVGGRSKATWVSGASEHQGRDAVAGRGRESQQF